MKVRTIKRLKLWHATSGHDDPQDSVVFHSTPTQAWRYEKKHSKKVRIKIWSRFFNQKDVEQTDDGAWMIRFKKIETGRYFMGEDVEEFTDRQMYDDLVKEATASIPPVPKLPTPKPSEGLGILKIATGRKFR